MHSKASSFQRYSYDWWTKPSSMGRYRAIMTETDREYISEETDPSDTQFDQSVYRVRKRINEELPEDIEVLREHRPDLLQELREIVCEEE